MGGFRTQDTNRCCRVCRSRRSGAGPSSLTTRGVREAEMPQVLRFRAGGLGRQPVPIEVPLPGCGVHRQVAHPQGREVLEEVGYPAKK